MLKPLSVRKVSVTQVIGRLRHKLDQVAGARLFLQAVQDIWVGGRQSNAQYQYTLQGDNTADIYGWAPKVEAALQKLPGLTEVNLDQQQKGLETDLVIDRATAARLGLNVAEIDNTLYDAFGQRQVSAIYAAQNQYHVVMEVAPRVLAGPAGLEGDLCQHQRRHGQRHAIEQCARRHDRGFDARRQQHRRHGRRGASRRRHRAQPGQQLVGQYRPWRHLDRGGGLSTADETMVPLSAFSHFGPGNTPLAVNHQGLFVAATISFNLAPGVALSQAQQQIDSAVARLGLPATVHGSFQGTAQVFEQSLANEPILVAAALVAVYIVLGVLYESYVHPLTILSTLPSAGVGAVLALIVTGTEFSIIALIGLILLIGIVKKNAIMMIDFALDAERTLGLSSREAIYQACLKRFRPIIMTTLAAMLGALPLAIGFGEGAELRRPLGISIVGGLMVSQVLTLYTTPVIYLYLDRFRLWAQRRWEPAAAPRPPAGPRTRRMRPPALKAAAAAAAAALLSACTVGPDYLRPGAPVPARFEEAQYKEAAAPPRGWKLGQPSDAISRGEWWTIYNDRCSTGWRRASTSPTRT